MAEAPKSSTLGHNRKPVATKEAVIFFAGAFLKQQAIVKKEQKELSRIRNRAASAGIKVEQFLHMLKLREQNSDLVFERMNTLRTYCQFMEIPLGGQLHLFEDIDPNDQLNVVDEKQRATGSGYLLGLLDLQPDVDTQFKEAHLKGWKQGQVENAAMLAELKKPDQKTGKPQSTYTSGPKKNR